MQENMIHPNEQDESWKRFIIRDLKMSSRLRYTIRQSVQSSWDAVIEAIHGVWLDNPGAPRTYVSHRLLTGKHQDWVRLDVEATPSTNAATIILHVRQGYLLIDGRTLGKAPPQIQDDANVKMLFPQRYLFTYPSSLRGMSYALSGPEENHHIHFGFRDNNLIIRAVFKGRILEFIPSTVFSETDLPLPLIEKCVHWLDVSSGKVHVREQSSKWEPSKTNWIINVFERYAYCQNLTLIDVGSGLFTAATNIFKNFEQKSQIMVLQSTDGLQVDLRRYQLEFSVKENGLLYSRKLRAEIDPNQDAGTFYGLKSMVVLREPQGPKRRSLIVPRDIPTVGRNTFHVSTKIIPRRSELHYIRFGIDEIVGRITCPAESNLYMKCLLHSYTSFVLPDPLTGKTGTEEALSCLYSGSYQPWAPLDEFACQILKIMVELSPEREYYPSHLGRQQQVTWNKKLTWTIQHDDFADAVHCIVEKSKQLAVFTPSDNPLVPFKSHLTRRALCRRYAYERSFSQALRCTAPDTVYRSRDRIEKNQATQNVLSIVSAVRSWPSTLNTANRLASFLESTEKLGGIEPSRVFDDFTIQARISVDLHQQWGAIANLCLRSRRDRSFSLMFLFGLMAFDNKVDMTILRSLLAFALFDELRDLNRPPYSEYHNFELNEPIPYQVVYNCIQPYQVSYISNYNLEFEEDQRRDAIHRTACAQETDRLAKHLIKQWPDISPSIGNFHSTYLSVAEAVEAVAPNWTKSEVVRVYQQSPRRAAKPS